jgi:hypothetical protein
MPDGVVSTPGPKGDTGKDGEKGNQEDNGKNGVNGHQGARGKDGKNADPTEIYRGMKKWNPASVSFTEARDQQTLNQAKAYTDGVASGLRQNPPAPPADEPAQPEGGKKKMDTGIAVLIGIALVVGLAITMAIITGQNENRRLIAEAAERNAHREAREAREAAAQNQERQDRLERERTAAALAAALVQKQFAAAEQGLTENNAVLPGGYSFSSKCDTRPGRDRIVQQPGQASLPNPVDPNAIGV